MNCSRFQITDARIALLFMALFAIFSGATVTYISAVLTTLEKRFEFNSMEMGALMGANDIGYLLSVIFIAYFGSKNNRQPYMLFLSGIGLWISCMTYTTPYFIYGSKYDGESLININATGQKGLCIANSTDVLSTNLIGKGRNEVNHKEKSLTMFILMIAGIINGVASAPFWCLGISFLDDMTGPAKSGIYIGTLYATRTCAPIIGFLLGSYVLKVHESLKIMVSQYAPGQKDLKWIGAWWLGWMILGFCVLLPTPFMLFLKANKPKVTNTPEEDKTEKMEFIKDSEKKPDYIINHSESLETTKKEKSIFFQEIFEIFNVVKAAFKNKIFSTLVCGMIFEIISFICFLTFFTKFLEYHYRVSASMANIMGAFCLAGSSMVSSLTSGLTSHFYKMSLRNMNKYHAIVNTVSAMLFPILFIFSCPSTRVHGLDIQSKISMCSNNCFCQIGKMEPVCFNLTTYFSPCIAGCTKQINETFYSNCGCNNLGLANKGFCEKMCLSVYGLLSAFFVIKIIGAIASVQFTQVLMRLADPKSKAMNLSIIGFIFGICGLSLPPLAGSVLDTACTYRNVNKFGIKSHCLIYDNDMMRYLILGVAFALQIPACILYIYAWRSTKEDSCYQYDTIPKDQEGITKSTITDI